MRNPVSISHIIASHETKKSLRKDLDRLYFAIYKFTEFHGVDSTCTFPGYDATCENLLGLCYEIRHAWQGDRDIEQVYNGIREDWFDDYQEAASHKMANENIARITLFANHTLHTLYRFIGEEKYNILINKFNSQRDFFLNCDLKRINSTLVDYGEKEYVNDDPDHLFSVLMSLFGTQ